MSAKPDRRSASTFQISVPASAFSTTRGGLVARFGDVGYGHAADRFLAPHGIAVDSCGDIYVGEVANAAWPVFYRGQDKPSDLRTLRKLARVKDRAPQSSTA